MDYKTANGIVIDRRALTPRLQECLDIKTQYPDSIVLFEIGVSGDYFEAYGEDAVKVAKLLDLVVTYKKATEAEGSIDRIQATTIPSYSYHRWIRTLLLVEKSVVVVEWKAVQGKPDRSRVCVASMTVSLRETPESIDRFRRLGRGKPT